MASSERLAARITGRVQGVGYRYFTTREAQALGLTGWVRNEPDGAVRLVVEGPREALEQLLQRLHQGPRTARVDDVAASWHPAEGGFDGFETRFA